MRVGDRYEVNERLGGGAMADVHRAHDRQLDRDVALKLLRPALVEDREQVARFERESDVAATIVHPNVVAVLDHGRIGDTCYLAMELVEGPTLQRYLRERGPLPEAEARRIGAEIAAGLHAAHERGLVHRDLKPGNVMLGSDGSVKVGDFGVAYLDAMTGLTRTGQVLGTPRYMAPEQLRGRVDARTDVYALGAVMYELVTGTAPFDGISAMDLIGKHLNVRPVPPRVRTPHLSRELDAILMRALEKEPRKRFASAAAMADALTPRAAAPVPALAIGIGARHAGRAAFSLVAALVLLLTVAGAAVRVGAEVATTPRQTVGAVAPTAMAPSAKPTDTPGPTVATSDASTPPPPPTPRPTPSAEAPHPAAASARVAVAVPASDPTATLARFYELVSGHDYDAASGLWSARMRSAYPPETNINGRFDATRTIALSSATVIAQTATAATVAVRVHEVGSDGNARDWTGRWYLVRSGDGWLMDAPSLFPTA